VVKVSCPQLEVISSINMNKALCLGCLSAFPQFERARVQVPSSSTCFLTTFALLSFLEPFAHKRAHSRSGTFLHTQQTTGSPRPANSQTTISNNADPTRRPFAVSKCLLALLPQIMEYAALTNSFLAAIIPAQCACHVRSL
jgi:hypothetical protein